MRPVKFNANEVVPAIPTVTPLVAMANGAAVNLTWADNSSTEYRYEVTRTAYMAPGVAAVAVPAVKLLANSTAYTEALPAIGGNVLTYGYTVAAVGANGNGEATVVVPVTVAAPSGVTAVQAGIAGATVSWTDNSFNETQFIVEQSLDNTNWTVVSTPDSTTTVATGGVKSLAVTGLAGGTTYYFRVSAKLVAGASTFTSPTSAPFTHAQLFIPPVAPTNVNYTVTGNMLTATFKDASVNETDFVVMANGVVLLSIPTTTGPTAPNNYTSSAVDLSVLPTNVNYTIGVLAKNTVEATVSTQTTAARTLNMTAKPVAAAIGTGNVTVNATNPNRTLTIPNAAFTGLAQTATTTYMPITSYDVTVCKVTASSAANAANAACVGNSTLYNFTVAAAKTLNLGVLLTGNGASNYYKYAVTAKNLVGASVASKTVGSR
jgi:hypothetical protein